MFPLRCAFYAFLMLGAEAVLAQSDALLPASMSGRWTFVGPAGVFTDTLSLVFEGTRQPGPIRGRITVAGVTCGARDEPLTGTWDGTELRFESRVRANVNASRMNGECGGGSIHFVLVRKPGEAVFEGESRREGQSGASQIKLAP